MRLNIERQNTLEPERIKKAKSILIEMGFEITFEDTKQIQFNYKNERIFFFPYSGWHSGKSINSGRGLQNLIKQLI